MKNHYNTHHIVPRCRGGTNNPDNLIRMRQDKHAALHLLLDRGSHANLPHKQIEKLLEIQETVYNPRFLRGMEELLHDTKEYIYKNGIIRRDYMD